MPPATSPRARRRATTSRTRPRPPLPRSPPPTLPRRPTTTACSSRAPPAASVVNLYTTAGCTGAPVAQGTAAEFASPGFAISVADDTTTAFRATATDGAGNVSPCSAARIYVEDSTAPPTPQITDTDPDSPANDNSLLVKGTGGGKTVKLYKTAGCTGAPVAQGSATQFASPGFLAAVADNTTTSFRATATDAAGNVSGCSAPRQYREDSAPPPRPRSPTPTRTRRPTTTTHRSRASPAARQLRLYKTAAAAALRWPRARRRSSPRPGSPLRSPTTRRPRFEPRRPMQPATPQPAQGRATTSRTRPLRPPPRSPTPTPTRPPTTTAPW